VVGYDSAVCTVDTAFCRPYGISGIQPPWGKISAVDINKGDILWSVPLGEYPVLAEMGITNTGSEKYGGIAVTAGGRLIFVAATVDSKFRAFDKSIGALLWEYQMEAPGYLSP
jgi:quinoprotein glucose dehydrogenase